MAKQAYKQTALKFNKRGCNSVEASKLIKNNKKEWERLFKDEINKEKQKNKPNVTLAAKRASGRYKKVKVTWSQALKRIGSCNGQSIAVRWGL